MHEPTLSDDPDNDLSVILRLNLGSYCSAYLKQNNCLDYERMAFEQAFSKERTALLDIVTGLAGTLHWAKIFKQIFDQSQRLTQSESLFKNFKNNKPHVVQTLENYFIELFKNSIDAMLKNYLLDQNNPTLLELTVSFVFSNQNISVIIKDNGCGFSQTDLKKFQHSLSTSSYQNHDKSTKDKANFYVGGAGRGLSILLTYFLDGAFLSGSGQLDKQFTLPKGQTSVTLSNCQKGGAEIKLTSPLLPFLPYENLTTINKIQLLPPTPASYKMRHKISSDNLAKANHSEPLQKFSLFTQSTQPNANANANVLSRNVFNNAKLSKSSNKDEQDNISLETFQI